MHRSRSPDQSHRAGPSAFNLLATLGSARTGVYDTALRELVLDPAPTNADDDDVDGLLTVGDIRGATDRIFRNLGADWESLDALLLERVRLVDSLDSAGVD